MQPFEEHHFQINFLEEIGDIPVFQKSLQIESQFEVFRNQNVRHLYQIFEKPILLKQLVFWEFFQYLYTGYLSRYELIFLKVAAPKMCGRSSPKMRDL